MTTAESNTPTDFIRQIVADDLRTGKHDRIITRFPPEPNGYLHIGHAKSICLNFGIAQENASGGGGVCHLRFDDTNPIKEEQRYIDAIREDVRWLGFDWGEHEYYASDYFDQLYAWAQQLIEAGKAYVDDQSAEQIRLTRGTLTRPGQPSPCRERSAAENLDLLERMRAGEFAEGAKVLRAKIDMAAPNINLRDPVMYRILRTAHPRTGETWCIYPTYDWAHGQSDSIENITHSICTLEFEDHRPLYEWYQQQLGITRSRQIEFARLNLTYTLMSKRKLLELVQEGHVSGWDDPRMPTLSGMRRRGYTPQAIRAFCEGIGVSKRAQTIQIERLEHTLREDLNVRARRAMAVLDPLKVVIENYPEGQVDQLDATNNPEDESMGTRQVPFAREIYIERDDFMEDPPRKFHRLAPGQEVRLRWGYFITCNEVIKDDTGNVVELRCTYDPETRGGQAPDGRRVKGTIHWVSAQHALDAEVRLYDHLFTVENPEDTAEGQDYRAHLNPASLSVLTGCKLEPALGEVDADTPVQFERQGYFRLDSVDASPGRLVFNRTVSLRDTWAKMQKAGATG